MTDCWKTTSCAEIDFAICTRLKSSCIATLGQCRIQAQIQQTTLQVFLANPSCIQCCIQAAVSIFCHGIPASIGSKILIEKIFALKMVFFKLRNEGRDSTPHFTIYEDEDAAGCWKWVNSIAVRGVGEGRSGTSWDVPDVGL